MEAMDTTAAAATDETAPETADQPVAMATDEQPCTSQQARAQEIDMENKNQEMEAAQHANPADQQQSDSDRLKEASPQPSTSAAAAAAAAAAAGAASASAESSGSASATQPTVSSAPEMDEEDAKWHTVGIFPELTANVTSFIDNSVWSSSGMQLTSKNLPDLSKFARINLEPGTAYRFRLRAINSVGTSDWSEVSSFKTCLPGFPGAPSAIKISKSSEGAHLTWEPPPSCMSSHEIIEYSVYLAVKTGKDKDGKPINMGARSPAQLAFVRVYMGPSNQCTVSHSSLATAHIDCSNKPAIIFRIAARNDKGYGPATQVRWLQDPVLGVGGSGSSLLSPSRIKPEMGGASPSKRFKSTGGGGGSAGRTVWP